MPRITAAAHARCNHRRNRAMMEALEDRQLMSLTIQVRAADGSASATATSVGQVLTLQVVGVVSAGTVGASDVNVSVGQPATYGVNDVTGSLISTAVFANPVKGTVATSLPGTFQANGFQVGTQRDLNGDGSLDVGSNTPTDIAGYFFPRHGGIDTSGTVSGNTNSIVLGTVTYTVTSLNGGGETDLNFAPRPKWTTSAGSGIWIAADWFDGVQYNVDSSTGQGQYGSDQNDTLSVGTPFVIKNPALNPAPVVNTKAVNTVRNSPVSIDALANVTTSASLVASSEAVGTAPAHGTAVVQGDGTILYTPTTGYTGPDSFTYHITDANGKTSNNGTVNVTVAVPAPPVSVNDSATTLRNQPVSITVLTNDTAPAGTLVPSTVAVTAAPAHGTAVAQADGTILYTPSTGYVGGDSFTYTVADNLGDTSNASAVSLTVTLPVPPVAVADIASNVEGGPTSISVLANDTSQSAVLDPTKVVIGAAPSHGTAVPQADGTVLYTSTPGYIGADSFTYTNTDVLGDSSSPATVSVDVTAAPPPVAGSFTAPVTAAVGTSINVLTNSSSDTTLVPSSVTIGTAPANGTTVVDAVTGAITYTAKPGFVGTDTFTYTVADANGNTSTPGTVTLNNGAELSSAKGGNRSITFTNSAGVTEIVTLNKGTAEVLFTGAGTATTAKGGKVAITGTSLDVATITLSGTTKASSLVLRSVGNKTFSVGAISDTAALGSINAKFANLTGNVDLPAGVNSIVAASMNGATLTIGSGAPKVALSLGTVTNSSITSAVPISSLKVASWANGPASSLTIAAPSIGTISSTGGFDPIVTLSSAVSLNALKVGGTFGGSLTAAGTIGSLVVGGDLTAPVTGVSAKSIRVTGSITNTTLTFTGAAGIGQLAAGAMTGSIVTAATTAGTTLDNVTAASLGAGSIGSIKLTGRTGTQFSNSSILAGKIKSVSLGEVNTSNNSVSEGIATTSLGSLAGIFGGNSIRANHAQLATEALVQSYLTQQAVVLGDFKISIL